jgi:hypothetical protein
MKTITRTLRLFGIALILILPLVSLHAQDSSPLNGTWQGNWTESSGYIYRAEAHLKAADSTIVGSINWTLMKSPQTAEQFKLGMTGIEYVHGKFDPQSRVLTFEGYKKDDPNIILGLDKYKLILADNDKVVGGITSNHGTWTGLLSLTRQ